MPKLCLYASLLAALVLPLCLTVASAQTSLFDDLKGLPAPASTEPVVTVSAAFTADKNSRKGQLAITADIAESWHIYSITQAPGGPIRSKIKLDASPDFKVTGDFKPSVPPKKHVDDEAYKGLTLEEHAATVTWTAPIELTSEIEPAKIEIHGKLLAQACSTQCMAPEDFAFTGTFDPSLVEKNRRAPASSKRAANQYKVDDITFSGYVSPRMVVSGAKLTLVITAEPAIGWHIYELGDKPAASSIGSRPTLIVLTETSGLKEGLAVASEKPLHDARSSVGHHEEAVTWTVEMSVPPRAKRGPIKIRGLLGYQICKNNDGGCKPPDAFGFEANLTLGAQTVDGEVPLEFTSEHRYSDVEKLVKNPSLGTGKTRPKPDGGNSSLLNPDQFKPAGVSGEPSSLAFMMGMGFLGGLILNLMPCVLPVIGLKILSFVEQSGHSRRQSFLLNFWYSLGMLAVFMVLATLPVVSRLWFNKQFGWGQQFSYDAFNVTLTAIVFVMALSFLGVWEIPIPGFVGGNKAGKLASKEGVAGAFSKGAITTVLATPCSGPFLGSALGFAVAQPPLVTYLMFASIGVGMASPYLLIGAFPQLLRFLPKPGAWMDTFKQTMGFVLLATVVYLMTLIRWPLMVPTLALLIGLWAACWWIGRTPLYAELPAKARAWTIGAIFATVVGVVAFQSLQPIMRERFQRAVEQEIAAMGGMSQAPAAHVSVDKPDRLPWRPFSMQELAALTREGKTVMVDFTADWCVTCKTLENLVLNTAETKQVVMASGIVTMVADMTRYPPEESSLLEKLSGGKLVPVLAIFPAGRPNEPIVLNNAYTKGLLFEKLKEAGPSKGSAQAGALTAMRIR